MDADEIALHGQIEAHKKRLRILEERAAIQGINTSPEVIIEIDVITKKIIDLQQKLLLPLGISRSTYNLQPDIKYYVYVSDTTINMFYSQLSLDVEDDRPRARYFKLRTIINHLEEKSKIGDITSAKMFAKFVLPMKSARWGANVGILRREFVIFIGRINNVIVVMGGYTRDLDVAFQDRFDSDFGYNRTSETIYREIANRIDGYEFHKTGTFLEYILRLESLMQMFYLTCIDILSRRAQNY